MFQEFYFEFIIKTGQLNVGPDHLSRIESGEEPTILEDNLLDTQFFAVTMIGGQNKEFNVVIHFLSIGYAPEGFSTI